MASTTSNDGSTFVNLNDCYSFTMYTSNSANVRLSAFPCSEAIIHNHAAAGNHLIVFSGGRGSSNDQGFYIDGGLEMTFRGLTNSSELSAKYVSSTSFFSCRTQFFSLMGQPQ